MAHFLEITQEDERLIIAPIFHSKKEQNEFRKIVFEKSERKILNHISSQLEIPTTPLEIDRYLLVRLIDTIDTHRFRRSSVTRFGEILPIWQNFTNIWQIFDCSFPVWQYTDPTLAKL